MDLDVEVEQAAGGLQAQQAAADHRGAARPCGVVADGGAVVERAEHEDAAAVAAGLGEQAFHRRDKRRAAGGDDQLVVGLDAAVGAHHLALLPVHARHRDAGVQADVVLLVPGERVDEDVLRVVGACQDARQQDPVVVAVRLVAEDRDVEPRRVARDHLLHQPRAGHAVANHHQPFPRLHGRALRSDALTRAAHTLNSGILLIGSSAVLVSLLADCSSGK